jgi:hypothetical protein
MQIGLSLGITAPQFVGSAWSPLSIASVRDWWRISNTALGGGTLAGVAGEAGNLDLAQATPSAQPTTGATIGTNAIKAVTFNGTSQFLAVAETLSQPFTLAAIVQATSATAQQALWDFDGSTNRNWFGVQASNTYRLDCGTFANFSAATDTNAHVLIVEVNGASSKLYIDGTLAASTSAGSNGITALRLGLRGDDSVGWQGKVSDCALFSAALATDDRTSLNSYLADLAGI